MALVNVKKADGQVEPFSQKKLKSSLRKAGAGSVAADSITEEILETFKGQTASTSQIYKKAFDILKKKEVPATAARYSLKRAVLGLGPSGFPFEFFLTEIFRTKGYETETGVVLNGSCVPHEIDVVAVNDREVIGVEAKFHNSLGFKTDVKVILYVAARFNDLAKSAFDGRMKDGMEGKGMIITNTDFTSNAVKYAKCAGIEIISWSYPQKGNLHDLIEESKLHPLTCLTTLPARQKKALLDKGTVLCKMIQDNESILREAGLSENKAREVLNEARMVCKPGKLT